MSDSLPLRRDAQRSILVEACVSSVAEAIAAVEVGADRLELCSALEVGGLTPSVGLVERVLAAVSVPVMAMIRPRVGDFTPSEDEFATMLADIAAMKRGGVTGIVFGLLTTEGAIDAHRTTRVVHAADGLQTVFHRAIDYSLDPIAAAETLASLGVTRVLTSGGAPTALKGAGTIFQMVQRTAGGLEILPGGGVRAANLAQVIRETGCNQVHLGPSLAEPSHASASLNGPPLADVSMLASGAHRQLDPAALRDAIQQAASIGNRPNQSPAE